MDTLVWSWLCLDPPTPWLGGCGCCVQTPPSTTCTTTGLAAWMMPPGDLSGKSTNESPGKRTQMLVDLYIHIFIYIYIYHFSTPIDLVYVGMLAYLLDLRSNSVEVLSNQKGFLIITKSTYFPLPSFCWMVGFNGLVPFFGWRGEWNSCGEIRDVCIFCLTWICFCKVSFF